MSRTFQYADLDLYSDWVNGNDSTGDGSISAPWKTLNKAFEELYEGYDLGGYAARIHALGDSSVVYPENIYLYGYPVGYGSATDDYAGVQLLGDPVSPPIIRPSSENALTLGNLAQLSIGGLQLESPTGWSCIGAYDGAKCKIIDRVIFGKCGGGSAHMYFFRNAILEVAHSYEIIDTALRHLDFNTSVFAGAATAAAPIVVDVKTNWNLNADWFALFRNGAQGNFKNMSFPVQAGKTVTGKRGQVDGNSCVRSAGVLGANWPGTIAGIEANGGRFI